MKRLLLLAVLALATTPASAKVSVASLFRDGAVLQRDTPIAIWGRSDPGEKVVVRFADKTTQGIADQSGRWMLLLPATPASSQPRLLIVEGESAVAKSTVTLRDILVGDVWLCAGQSNIEWPVRLSNGGAEAAAQADFPTLRQLKIPRATAAAPREEVPVEWKMATQEDVPHFSGVGYFFARKLQSRLQVPIGLINCTYGGTAIESWFDPVSLAATRAGADYLRAWEKDLSDWVRKGEAYERQIASGDAVSPSGGKPPAPAEYKAPFGAYHGMLYSTIPYTIRGVLWYQGESNVGRHTEYRELFPALIRTWRQRWGQPELPFLFVQIPIFRDPNDASDRAWAEIRDAQTSALELKGTAMVVAPDAGEAENLHPTDKRTVGERAALAAGHLVYGWEGEWTGPQPATGRRDGEALLLTFHHAEGGVVLKDFMVSGFELADADGVFYPASAAIDGGNLRLKAGHVVAPVYVRYAWSNAPVPTLYNKAGFPAAPFRFQAR